MQATDAATVVEAHPESAFACMSGAPLTTSKKTVPGRRERLALLEDRFPGCTDHLLTRHPGAAADDVLDAAANAWTAQRWSTGSADVLGDGSLDARGLVMRIVV